MLQRYSSIGTVSFVVLASLALSTVVHAATIMLKPDGMGEYPTIQAAIDAASAGDEIVLTPGRYTEMWISFEGKAITIRSVDPEDPAVVAATVVCPPDLPGLLDFSVFVFMDGEGRDSVLAGLGITGAGADLMYSDPLHDAAIVCSDCPAPTIRNCVITDNTTSGIWGAGAALVENCLIARNLYAGILVGGAESPAVIRNCTFRENDCGFGSLACISMHAVVTNCRFENNSGNAIGVSGYAAVDISNCVFVNNQPEYPDRLDGTIKVSQSNATIRNCTISGNPIGGVTESPVMGDESPATVTVYNTIIWGNGGPALPDPVATGTAVDVSYCVVEGCWPEGTNVLDVDPLLLPNGRLSPASPCINAGDPAFAPDPDETDIDGQPRVLAGCVDIGADEFTHLGDINADGLVNIADLQILAAQWGTSTRDYAWDSRGDFDGNGQINVGDLQMVIAHWGSD